MNEAQRAALVLRHTPVESIAGRFVKRDDLFSVNGANGGKARATLSLAAEARGLVGVGARTSPQNARVARIAEHLGLPARLHTGIGEETTYTRDASLHRGELVRHNPPRLSVLKKRAADDAEERGWTLIPFGAVSPVTVGLTAWQARALPWGDFDRIVVPVGSGTTAAGIVNVADEHLIPVLGVRVGGDPEKVLDRYSPGWRETLELVDAGVPFEQPAAERSLGSLRLNAYYEAKCLPWLQKGDLLWIVGS